MRCIICGKETKKLFAVPLCDRHGSGFKEAVAEESKYFKKVKVLRDIEPFVTFLPERPDTFISYGKIQRGEEVLLPVHVCEVFRKRGVVK